MGLFILLIGAGAGLFIMGWNVGRKNRCAVVVTGTVVAVRRTLEYLHKEENKEKSLLMEGFDLLGKPRCRGELVEVFRPIVRFTYLGEAREAVVDERYFIKPTLNVSMEIAFFPEDLKHAWRPAKEALWGDAFVVAGVICMVLGVFLFLGVPLPFELPFEPAASLQQDF